MINDDPTSLDTLLEPTNTTDTQTESPETLDVENEFNDKPKKRRYKPRKPQPMAEETKQETDQPEQPESQMELSTQDIPDPTKGQQLLEDFTTPEEDPNYSPYIDDINVDEPNTLNVLRATYLQNKFTRNADTLSNLTYGESIQLEWANRVLHRFERETNWFRKGALYYGTSLETTIQNIASGNLFEELTMYGTALVAGTTIGTVGGITGGMIGGAIGGPVGARIGSTVGSYAGGLIGSAVATSKVKQKQLEKAFTGAGYEYPAVTDWETLKDVIKNVPSLAVTAGISYNIRVMRNAWAGNIKPKNVTKKTLQSNTRVEETYNDYAINTVFDGILEEPPLPPPITTPATGKKKSKGKLPDQNIVPSSMTEMPSSKEIPPYSPEQVIHPSASGEQITPTPESPRAEAPDVPSTTVEGLEIQPPEDKVGYQKMIGGKRRFNLYDIQQADEPLFQIEETTRKDGKSDFKFNKKMLIKSMEDLSTVMQHGHLHVMENSPIADRVTYLLSTALSVGDHAEAFESIYVDNILLHGIGPHKNVWHQLRGDREAQLEFLKYYFLEPNEISKYDKVLTQFAENSRLLFDTMNQRWRDIGVPQYYRAKYLPHNADPYKLAKFNPREVVLDLMGWSDFEQMGLLEADQVEKLAVFWDIFDSFREEDTMSTISYGGSGDVLDLGRRYIHFKDAKSYLAFQEKYGKHSNVFEVILNAASNASRAQAMVVQFGPKAEEVFRNLIIELDKEKKGFKFLQEVQRKAISQLYNGFFASGDSGYIAKNAAMVWIMKAYKSACSIGVNALTKNSMMYELLETPLNMAFMSQFYGLNESSVKSMLDGLTSFFTEMKELLLHGSLTDEQTEMLLDIGLLYGTGRELFPYQMSKGSLHDMPLNLRKVNAFLSKVKMSDDLNDFNKSRMATFFQHGLGREVVQNKQFSELKKEMQGLLQSAGIEEAEWNYILQNQEEFIVPGDDLEFLFGVQNEKLRRIRYNLLSYSRALKSKRNKTRAIGFRLAQLQNDTIYRVATQRHNVSMMAVLGKNINGDGLLPSLVKNLFALRGFAVDRPMRVLSKLDLIGHGPSKERFVRFVAERMTVGIFVAVMKWAATGRKPELSTFDDWVRFLGDAASRGDLFPFSIAADIFADTYMHAGKSFTDTLRDATGSSAMGPGFSYLSTMAGHIGAAVYHKADGDNEKAFKHMRRMNPFGGWLPTDFMVNRVILDNLFKAIDEDAAYELFKKEIEISNKQHFRYKVAPGDLAGMDVAQQYGQDTANYNVTKEITKYKKEGKKHPLAETKKQTLKELAKLRREFKKDPKANKDLERQMIKIQAKYDLDVAMYIKKNKPKNISSEQLSRMVKHASRKYWGG